MRIDVSTGADVADPTLRPHIERKLLFALGRFWRRIERVDVRLSDDNGPRGGIDKRCRLQVSLRSMDPLVVTAVDADFHGAISRAADKAGQALVRRIERTTSDRRRAKDPWTAA